MPATSGRRAPNDARRDLRARARAADEDVRPAGREGHARRRCCSRIWIWTASTRSIWSSTCRTGRGARCRRRRCAPCGPSTTSCRWSRRTWPVARRPRGHRPRRNSRSAWLIGGRSDARAVGPRSRRTVRARGRAALLAGSPRRRGGAGAGAARRRRARCDGRVRRSLPVHGGAARRLADRAARRAAAQRPTRRRSIGCASSAGSRSSCMTAAARGRTARRANAPGRGTRAAGTCRPRRSRPSARWPASTPPARPARTSRVGRPRRSCSARRRCWCGSGASARRRACWRPCRRITSMGCCSACSCRSWGAAASCARRRCTPRPSPPR